MQWSAHAKSERQESTNAFVHWGIALRRIFSTVFTLTSLSIRVKAAGEEGHMSRWYQISNIVKRIQLYGQDAWGLVFACARSCWFKMFRGLQRWLSGHTPLLLCQRTWVQSPTLRPGSSSPLVTPSLRSNVLLLSSVATHMHV